MWLSWARGVTGATRCPRLIARARHAPRVTPALTSLTPTSPSRALSVSAGCAKGHAKWQNIRHIKSANDMLKARVNKLHANRIIIAIRGQGGQTNPDLNRALKRAIDEARAHDVPKSTIDRSVASASDKATADLVESVHEVRGPGRTALLVECLAKNKRIAETAVQAVLRKRGGAIEPGISAMFDNVGEVTIRVPAKDEWDLNRAEDLAIECSAEDVSQVEDDESEDSLSADRYFVFACPPNQVSRLQAELKQQGHDVVHVESGFRAKTFSAPLSPLHAKMLELLVATLEKNESVVRVFHNAPPDSEVG